VYDLHEEALLDTHARPGVVLRMALYGKSFGSPSRPEILARVVTREGRSVTYDCWHGSRKTLHITNALSRLREFRWCLASEEDWLLAEIAGEYPDGP
jgi:hypothetical protein